MSIVLVGSTSGSVTLQEPAVAGTTVLDLPAVSGTLITTASSGQSIPKAALPTGSVLQVVNATYSTTTSTTSGSFVDTGLFVFSNGLDKNSPKPPTTNKPATTYTLGFHQKNALRFFLRFSITASNDTFSFSGDSKSNNLSLKKES